MRIVFDPDFDSGYWPGPLADKEASIDEAWVGTAGLLNVLETALGLTGKYPSAAQRVIGLTKALRNTEGFWSKSVKIDALFSAKQLLSWRDELWMNGWRGEGKQPRLAALAKAAKDLLPGIPDRLVAVAEALAGRRAEIERVELFDPIDTLPKTLREVFQALQKQGTELVVKDIEPSSSKGDLANLLQSLRNGEKFEPQGDGSVLLLRPYGILNAAEETAACLASFPKTDRTLLIQPDPVLDAALKRFALPTTGASSPSYSSPLQDILPLVLELGWEPIDPNMAFRLLVLPVSPVPHSLAKRLRSALRTWPAVGSPRWEGNLEEGLSESVAGENREKIKDRILALFDARAKRGGRYPLSEILLRVQVVKDWLSARRALENDDQEPYSVAVSQCIGLEKLFADLGQQDFSEMELGRMQELANEQLPSISPYPREAGFGLVNSPGSITGQAGQIVWWNFTRSSFNPPDSVPLTLDEKKELTKTGVHLPSATARAIWAARRWRRPLELASKRVLLVCPRRSQQGEDEVPHPLWDEITARLSSDSMIHRIQRACVSETLPLPRKERTHSALPAASATFSCPPPLLVPRKQESPNSLISQMSCPLRYVLKYQAKIYPGEGANISRPSDNMLKGNLAHHLLERLLLDLKDGKKIDPIQAKQLVEQWFDEETPKLAAEFYLPGFDIARANVKRVIGNAAQRLVQILVQRKAQVKGVEEPLPREVFSLQVEGKTDLLIGDPEAIFDLKWSRARYYSDELRSGTACQLAMYSLLRKAPTSKVYPPVAYFIIDKGTLLSQDKSISESVQYVPGPSVEESVQAMEKTCKENLKELANGTIKAPGNSKDSAPQRSEIREDGFIVLATQCEYCDFAMLCGNAFLKEQP